MTEIYYIHINLYFKKIISQFKVEYLNKIFTKYTENKHSVNSINNFNYIPLIVFIKKNIQYTKKRIAKNSKKKEESLKNI